MNAISVTPCTTEARPIALTHSGVSPKPVEEDREVVRGEIPDDAGVTLMKSEVHAAARYEVDLAELATVDEALHGAYRRAVDERVPAHQGQPALLRQPQQFLRFLARRGQWLLHERVLAGFECAAS